jgi:aspartate carbamoyltransferase catalytic subunit
VDVLYQTRIQKERFKSLAEYKKHKGRYIVASSVAERMKRGAIIMHPLPRVGEIALEVDDSPKAVYFKQARYGLFIRMALLKFLLE